MCCSSLSGRCSYEIFNLEKILAGRYSHPIEASPISSTSSLLSHRRIHFAINKEGPCQWIPPTARQRSSVLDCDVDLNDLNKKYWIMVGCTQPDMPLFLTKSMPARGDASRWQQIPCGQWVTYQRLSEASPDYADEYVPDLVVCQVMPPWNKRSQTKPMDIIGTLVPAPHDYNYDRIGLCLVSGVYMTDISDNEDGVQDFVVLSYL
jgi:hypothetical protein